MRVYRIFRLLRGDRRVMRRETLRKGRGGVRRRGHQSTSSKDETRLRAAGAMGGRRDEKRYEKGGAAFATRASVNIIQRTKHGYAPQARPPERSGASGPRERRRRGVRRGEAPRSREDARSITDDRCSASAACRDDDQQHEYEDGDCSDGDPDGARIPCAAAAVNVDVHLRRLRRLG
jgi:hypothetical protein